MTTQYLRCRRLSPSASTRVQARVCVYVGVCVVFRFGCVVVWMGFEDPIFLTGAVALYRVCSTGLR